MKYEVTITKTHPVLSFGVPVEQHTSIAIKFESPDDAAQWFVDGNLLGLPGTRLRDGWLRCSIRVEITDTGDNILIHYIDRLPVWKDGDQPTIVGAG